MLNQPVKQKLSCFVDETGQDDRSKHFIVVAVVCAGDREALEAVIVDIEQETKVGSKKWHKLRSPERETFLEFLVNAQLPAGEVFDFGILIWALPSFWCKPDFIMDEYQAAVCRS